MALALTLGAPGLARGEFRGGASQEHDDAPDRPPPAELRPPDDDSALDQLEGGEAAVEDAGDAQADEPAGEREGDDAEAEAAATLDAADEAEPDEAPKQRRRASKPRRAKQPRKEAKPAPPKGDADCDFKAAIHIHEVARGEHLGQIAGRYGVRRADVVRLNPSLERNPNLIRPGQKLRVCPELAPRERVEISHAVVAGDSLGKIATQHGLTVREIVEFQQGALRARLERNPNHLPVGVTIRLLVDREVAPEEEEADDGDVAAARVAHVRHQLTTRIGVVIKRPHLAFGTQKTIRALERALARYQRRSGGGPAVRVGDISRRGGGELKGHLSHRRGVDVDVGVIMKGAAAHQKKFAPPTAATLDVARTWKLVKAFVDTDEVRAIFLDYNVQRALYTYARAQGVSEDTLDEIFQYPRGRGRPHGLVRHWRGHRGHLHVRFRR
ncbi:MAG: penicillin-insensitive murein endopeptidase [Myxococcales bacterium]|nr:penicillin-insensitive murein endopeptidase [Myxococcales bacterium]